MNDYCEFDKLDKINKNKISIKKLKFETTLTRIEIKSKKDEEILNKTKGLYSTIFCNKFSYQKSYFDYLSSVCIKEIKHYLKKLKININSSTKVFVVGLGNHEVPADKLGYCVCLKIISTSNLLSKNKSAKKYFSNIFSIAPSVEYINGISTAKIIKILSKELKPDIVFLIDSLTCKNTKYLGKTLQISSVGLTPGGEISGNVTEINKTYLKTPVITIGCPLVISAKNLEKSNNNNSFFSSKDVVYETDEFAKIIAFSLNKVFHKKLNKEEILFLSKT